MRRTAIGFALAVGLLVHVAACAEQTLDGRVVGVTDGDTIVVLVDKREYKVRLHGVDAPERKQAFGTRARQFASDLVFGEEVEVEVLEMDRYGRHVGIVRLRDGRVLNHELVKAGLAWWYKEYAPRDTVLEHLEAEAKEAKRGLWADAHPVAPWEFRKKKSSSRATPAGARVELPRVEPREAPLQARVVVPTDAYLRTAAATTGKLVVIAPTGGKYHTFTCRHGRNGKRVTLDAACEAGYTACKACGGKPNDVGEGK